MNNSYRLLILITFLFSSVTGFSQKLSKGTSDKNYYTEIAYEYVNDKIIIPVVIENKTYRFLLDTGAPNIISGGLREIIKTKRKTSINVGDANGKKQMLDLVELPLLKIGGVSFKNTPTLVNKNAPNIVFDCFEIDGFIGSNMLRNSILQILPKQKIIKLTNSKRKLELNKKHASKLTLIGNQGKPFIWIHIDGEKNAKEHVLIDTGMKGFYDLSNRNFDIFKTKNVISESTEGQGSMGTGLFGSEEKSSYQRLVVPQVTINNFLFKNANVETTNSKNSRIGTELLNHGNMTIDFKNKRFYYEPFYEATDLQEKQYGFNPTLIDNKLAVGIVWDEELKKDMSYGDQIIEINGVDYTDTNLCHLINRPSIFKSQNTLSLVLLKASGEKKTIVLEKQ